MTSHTRTNYEAPRRKFHARIQALYDETSPAEIAAMRQINRWLFDNRDRAARIVGKERFSATWKTFFDGDYREAWVLVQEYDKALALAEAHPLGELPEIPEWCDNDADPWDAEYVLRAQELRDEMEAE